MFTSRSDFIQLATKLSCLGLSIFLLGCKLSARPNKAPNGTLNGSPKSKSVLKAEPRQGERNVVQTCPGIGDMEGLLKSRFFQNKLSANYKPKDHFQAESEWLLGQLDYSKDTRFTVIPRKYSNLAGRYLHKEALRAFYIMEAEAQKDGVQLIILSAARNFDYQSSIWERKWKKELSQLQTRLANERLYERDSTQLRPKYTQAIAKNILSYSAMPGTSRHHWGTEIDLNSFENSYFQHGQGFKVYAWLTKNAAKFGFCQAYTKKATSLTSAHRQHGYNEERWHWSYVPLACPLLQAYIKKIDYENSDLIDGRLRATKKVSLPRFSGDTLARKLKVIEHYAAGIAPQCHQRKFYQ